MTWLLPLLRHRVTWGVGICLGLLVAICVHGRLQFADGRRVGRAEVTAQRDSIDRIAEVAATAMRARTDSVIRSLQQALAAHDRAILVAKQARARAEGRYADALHDYEALKAQMLAAGDTVLTPRERACDEVATACAINLRAATEERDAIEAKLTAAEHVVAQQTQVLASEPARTAAAVRAGVTQDRALRRPPSRIGWFLRGVATGVVGVAVAVLR